MKKYRLWYTLTKHPQKKMWTVWLNREVVNGETGGCGSYGIHTAETKEDCLNYCKGAGIKLEKGIITLEDIEKKFANLEETVVKNQEIMDQEEKRKFAELERELFIKEHEQEIYEKYCELNPKKTNSDFIPDLDDPEGYAEAVKIIINKKEAQWIKK